jgi:hypothetical protein
MRYKLFLAILLISLALPAPTHAFGVLRWAWDAISNQLGFDRGPVPKIDPRVWPLLNWPSDNKRPITCAPPGFYIQADGF